MLDVHIRAMYVDMATTYTGPDFSDLDSYLAIGYGNCPLKYDDSGFLSQPVSDVELEIFAIPPPNGQVDMPFRRLKQVDREPLTMALHIVYPEFFREKPGIEDVRDGSTGRSGAILRTAPQGQLTPSGTGQLTPLIDMVKLREQCAVFLLETRERAELLFEAVTCQAVQSTPRAFSPRSGRISLGTPCGVVDSISEYVRLTQLAATMVPGSSVEVERTFSVMSYIKNKQRNRLPQPHLSACIRRKLQEWYGASNLPYTAALQHWQAAAHDRHNDYRRGGRCLICVRTSSSTNWRCASAHSTTAPSKHTVHAQWPPMGSAPYVTRQPR
ncbi:hypothetical protein PLESTF_000835100 [Pleodorina starrii]|nr:hypothetical protein PLESTF_000835100 [Pleodorina starrii]